MAFEIYNGIFSTAQDLIAKAAEMWDFDEVTETKATYGNVFLLLTDGSLRFYISSVNKYTISPSDPYRYSIVKSDNALLISIETSSGWATIVIGNTTNAEGTKGKGGVFSYGQADGRTGLGTDNWSSGADIVYSNNIILSDGLTQLVPIAAPYGGYYFENVFRTFVGTTTGIKGLYEINGERYYISNRTAIKE